ncbi:MAG TPA: cytidylate kinase-like family protein [Gemmatimonadales bacterium]|nr:cytidylate kinase-like family protein [Gemmatimonadales bacterium]
MLITVSRQFGAGGAQVAQRVADALAWSVVDNELIGLVAERAGLSPDEVARRDERVPSFVERLAQTLAVSSQEFALPQPDQAALMPEPEIVKVTEAVVREVAAQGRVVLVGRAASAVLSRRHDVLHVRVVASRPWRATQVAEREKIDAAAADKRVETMDHQRSRYSREYYARDWADPVHYHMTLNTEFLGLGGAAEVIVARARALGW